MLFWGISQEEIRLLGSTDGVDVQEEAGRPVLATLVIG
jgi:hypothetical protein